MDRTERVVYHVVPAQPGGWNVKQDNSGKALGTHKSRTQAILQARDLALAQTYSLLVVHDREGKVEKEYNYGRRPG
ncbi:MAG: DUF2188 domain-containing protein [Sedimentisphaerales bacterium]|nr:DUF2188 domain-containing protein [Sedimentisphaerales bacterium]